MPRSFLIKKQRPAQSPVPKKVQRFETKDESVDGKILPSSRSAFVAVSESCKLEAKEFKNRNDFYPEEKLSFGFHIAFPFSSSSFPVQFNPVYNGHQLPTSKPVSVLYSDMISKTFASKEVEKENLKRKSPEQSHVAPVKGPLPQSTFICQLCKNVYQDAFSLAQHKCSGIKHIEHRCPECNKVFSCPANLASHRRWHRPRSPTTNKPTKAPLKDNKAEKIESPNKKSKSKFEAAYPIVDLKPKETFTQQENVPEIADEQDMEENESIEEQTERDPNNNNIVSIETSDKNGPYPCSQCGKAFRREAYLRKHLNYHSDRRPYPCQYCGKVFRSLTNRAKHVLNHAVGPKIHTCNVCGNGFPSRASLDKHGRIHSGEIFSCPKCATTFYSSPGLQRHILKTHKNVYDVPQTSSLLASTS